MIIVKWLRRRIRNWLMDDNNNPIMCRDIVDGRQVIREYRVLGLSGNVQLLGASMDGSSIRVIRSLDAVDSHAFWTRVHQLNRGAKLTWEDSDNKAGGPAT